MERGAIVFGVLFLLVPLLIAIAVPFVGGAAFLLTILLVGILTLGFFWGIAFVDV